MFAVGDTVLYHRIELVPGGQGQGQVEVLVTWPAIVTRVQSPQMASLFVMEEFMTSHTTGVLSSGEPANGTFSLRS